MNGDPNDHDLFPVNDTSAEPEIKQPEGGEHIEARAGEALSGIPAVFDDPFAISTPAPEEVPIAEPAPEAPSPEAANAPSAPSAMDNLKQYSEKVTLAKTPVPAAYPFSLLIEGPLTAYEREKLCDVLSRENAGIREVDLEPQFMAERVLIPRISEYAGVLLIQALRGTSAKMKLAPSDEVYSTEDTRENLDLPESGPSNKVTYAAPDSVHPAERIPVTTEATVAEFKHARVIDTLTASAALRSEVVEAERSPEYQEILEALQRELKYKAYRKGAQAITHFKIALTQLTLPTHYRLMVTGQAVTTAVTAQPT